MLEMRIKEIEQKGAAEKWTYPQFFDALKGVGVTHYEIDVPKHEIVYFSMGKQYAAPPPQDFQPFTAATAFDETGLKHALGRVQRRETTYPQFLHEIAAAGVHRYRVSMATRTVSYMGANGEATVEKVPASA